MFQVYNFTTASGRQPVDEFINKQPQKVQEKIDGVISYLKEYGFHLGTDYLRRMSGTKRLWELRSRYRSKQYRIFIAKIDDAAIIMLHAIIKKTNKTPSKDIHTAEKRLQQVVSMPD